MRDKSEMETRLTRKNEAVAVLESVAQERQAVEDQIAALQRTLAVILEREKDCRAQVDAACSCIEELENLEASESAEVRQTRAQHDVEVRRVREEMEENQRLLEQVCVCVCVCVSVHACMHTCVHMACC